MPEMAQLLHVDRIPCLFVLLRTAHVPVVGGYDGKVILWKIDGIMKAVLTTPDHDSKSVDNKPIEKLTFLAEKDSVLAAAGKYAVPKASRCIAY